MPKERSAGSGHPALFFKSPMSPLKQGRWKITSSFHCSLALCYVFQMFQLQDGGISVSLNPWVAMWSRAAHGPALGIFVKFCHSNFRVSLFQQHKDSSRELGPKNLCRISSGGMPAKRNFLVYTGPVPVSRCVQQTRKQVPKKKSMAEIITFWGSSFLQLHQDLKQKQSL